MKNWFSGSLNSSFGAVGVIALSTFFTILSQTRGGTAESLSPPQKFALLVGIDHYQVSENDLDGCVNDVKDVKALLSSYGFPAKNIKLVCDAQATHQGIVKAFEDHLIARSNSGDTVVFYYAGHGSQTLDFTKPPEGRVDSLVPYDSRQGDVRDITAYEMRGLVRKLLEKTKDVTIIFDSCYSGNMLDRGFRGKAAKIRSIEPDNRPAVSLPVYADVLSPKMRGVALTNDDHVVLSACLSNQKASEYNDNGQPRGAFTCFLTSILRQLDAPKYTFRDLLEIVSLKLAKEGKFQTPIGVGKLNRIPFGGEIVTSRPFVEIGHEDNLIVLKGGEVLRQTVGSRYAVFAPQTKDFSKSNPIASLRIIKVTPTFSVANLEEKSAVIPDLARAVEVEHAFGNEKVTVSFMMDDQVFVQQVTALLDREPGIKIIGTDSVPDILVRMSDAKDKAILFDQSGTPLAQLSYPLNADRLAEAIQWFAIFMGDCQLGNNRSQHDLKVTVARAGALAGTEPNATFQSGDNIEVSVVNESSEDWHFIVLDFSSDGSVSAVYPPNGISMLLSHGLKTPYSIAAPVSVSELWRSRMKDTIKVIFTKESVDYTSLLRPSYTEMIKRKESGNETKQRVIGQGIIKTTETWITSARVIEVLP